MIKRLLFAVAAIVLALPVCAQYYEDYGRRQNYSRYADEHNIYYGLRLGLALSSVHSDEAQLDAGGLQAGLNVGALIGFQLSPAAPVYLETGLYYTEKGGKGRTLDGGKTTFDLNYFEMPIVIKYKYDIDGDMSVQPFAGGYLALGVGGKMKNFSERVTNSSFSETNFKRFDGGLRLGCGFEYQIIYAELAYEYGLTNICHSDFESSHNSCLYINCGVNF